MRPRATSLLAVALLAAAAAFAGAAAAQAIPDRRIFAPGADGLATIHVDAGPGLEFRVLDEMGRTVRDWAPGEPAGEVRLPAGGWYRLERRDGSGAAATPGPRFAVGLVVLVTGQSQADGLFFATSPGTGAFAAGPGDPAAPPVSALLHDCHGAPRCGPEGTAWSPVGEALGARVLLAELARRLGRPVPLALALGNASWGGAGIRDLADAAAPAGASLRRVAASAAPASAAVLLAHGTTDTFRGTPPDAYRADLAAVVMVLRAAGPPGMPVLQAPLSPLDGPIRLLGSRRLAAWLLPPDGGGWPTRLGLARRSRGDPEALRRAAAVREVQAAAARELGLLPGGAMEGVALGPDGVHWSPEGVREAARRVAAALADALAPPPR
jgi:lysophospholipase L1-like esterase